MLAPLALKPQHNFLCGFCLIRTCIRLMKEKPMSLFLFKRNYNAVAKVQKASKFKHQRGSRGGGIID